MYIKPISILLILVLLHVNNVHSTSLKRVENTQFADKSIQQVLDIATMESNPTRERIEALRYLSKLNISDYKSELVSLYNSIKMKSIMRYNSEIDTSTISVGLNNQIQLFRSICIALGNINNPETIQFLIDQTLIKNWDNKLKNSTNKSASSEMARDALFRHYVFQGILEAALKKPELFKVIESYPDEYLGDTKLNVKSWLIEYKEKYYKENPNKVPEKGYILLEKETPIDAINFLKWRIQLYFEKNQFLPDELFSLTIPEGGDCVFLPVDPYGYSQDLIKYKYTQSGNTWTYILVSVGANKKLDIDLSKLKDGMTSEDAVNVFNENVDDIYRVLTYISY